MNIKKRILLLQKLLDTAAKEITVGSTEEVAQWAHRFEEEGIVPAMHTGKVEEMKPETPEADLLRLEWFAGALMDIHVQKYYAAVNSWINMSSTLLPKEVEET